MVQFTYHYRTPSCGSRYRKIPIYPPPLQYPLPRQENLTHGRTTCVIPYFIGAATYKYKQQDVRHHADRERRERRRSVPLPEDAHQVRVCVPVLPEAVHQVLQPDDPRADAQESRTDLQLRGLRQELQAPGQPQTP
nr:unnamed protein product [Callosobruchus analis]